MKDIETRTIAKVSARLIPFLILCYFVAYLDRVNVGFAAITMNKDLGLTATAFGFGSGIFFIAYFLFEVPSNLMLDKFGARKWIARIMITWGFLSGAMAFIPQISAMTGISKEYTFYSVRVLLGLAEAGFFPGIIFYLTLWFPAVYRARIIGYFMAAIPLSSVIGSPISGALLGFDGYLGMAGWQWLFIIEAVPAIILSFVVLGYLTDRPTQAAWLTEDERTWLSTRLVAEDESGDRVDQAVALASSRVLEEGCREDPLALRGEGHIDRVVHSASHDWLDSTTVRSTAENVSGTRNERRFSAAFPGLFGKCSFAPINPTIWPSIGAV